MNMFQFWDFIQDVDRAYADCRKTVMDRFSLSAAEVDILLFLANNPQFNTNNAIAQIRRIPKSHVSLAVNSLCRRGLLCRTPEPGNKKKLHLTPTEQAAETIRFGLDAQKQFYRNLFQDFTEADWENFSRLHEKIANNIRNSHRGVPVD